MGWVATLYDGPAEVCRAHCSTLLPDRQRERYGFDFLEALAYYQGGWARIGDPITPAADGPQGMWTPDWSRAAQILGLLRERAEAAQDAPTIHRLPEWEEIVRYGLAHPHATVRLD